MSEQTLLESLDSAVSQLGQALAIYGRLARYLPALRALVAALRT